MKERAPSATALVRLVPVDVAFLLLVPPLFGFTLGLAHPVTATLIGFALCLVRTSTWVYRLKTDLAPVDRWHAAAQRHHTDELVRSAAYALREGLARFRTGYVLGWLVELSLLVTWAIATDGVLSSTGLAFLIPGGLVCFTVALAARAHAQVQASVLLAELGADVLVEAEQRRLDLPLPTGSIRVRAASLALIMVAAPLGWLGAIGYRAAELGAAREAVALARLDAHAQTARERRALPDDVARWLTHESARAAQGSRVDAAEGVAFAFVRTDAGLRVGRAPIDRGAATSFVWLLAGFFVVVSVWAPITAAGFGEEIGETVGRVTARLGRVLEIGDLSAMPPLPATEADEVGELTRHVNELVTGLRALAERAGRVARGDLTGTIDGAGELPDSFRGMLDGLRTVVGRVQSTAVELASAAAEIYSASQEQEAAATQQSAGMIEVTRTMDSLSDSAAHIAGSVGSVLGDAERTRTTTEQMAQRIAELNAHAGRIAELLEVIREVADRSDLLALNGSLEATRAGESGRGFSLVAAEMRRLAERVTATVANVRTLVVDVRASGSATVMATDQSRKLAESTSEAARRITLVTQQQRTATEQVTASVREVADVLAQAAVATTQTRVSAENLKVQAEELEALLARFEMASVGAAA